MSAGSMISKKIKEEAAAEVDENSIAEQEEALAALIEHRTKEVEQLGNRISYYKSQLVEAERRLQDSQSKLARLRGRKNPTFSNASLVSKSVKVDQISTLEWSSAKNTISLEASPASNSAMKVRAEASHRSSSNPQVVETKDRGVKRKFEQKEHKELIPLVRNSSSLTKIGSYPSNHISSQHKRKLRSLAVCPVNDQLFVTSALDGIVHLWQIQAGG
ncbi:APO protein 3 [Hibiscus syriacus]|uniref:APO protein 3 n=1 Tax=Hibiscus syriacus TaxID=106335 RepID=A0A6A3APP9_HIBSY|nr:APO protein 3 [Hibiscus syriacus]